MTVELRVEIDQGTRHEGNRETEHNVNTNRRQRNESAMQGKTRGAVSRRTFGAGFLGLGAAARAAARTASRSLLACALCIAATRDVALPTGTSFCAMWSVSCYNYPDTPDPRQESGVIVSSPTSTSLSSAALASLTLPEGPLGSSNTPFSWPLRIARLMFAMVRLVISRP